VAAGLGVVVCALALQGSLAAVAGAQPSSDPVPTTQPSPTKQDLPRGSIVGGSNQSVTGYPWMAALLRDDTPDPFAAQFCGGVLIDPSWILTAGHCIQDRAFVAADVDVVLSKTNLDTIVPGDRRAIDQIMLAPSYTPADPPNAIPPFFDMALLHLTTPALGIPTMAFATDTSGEVAGQGAVILGWGATDAQGSIFANILQGALVRVISSPGGTVCGSYNGTQFHPASQICAGVGNTGGSPDVCFADDGGPLAVGNAGGWRLIGIASDGPNPCAGGNPSEYARVSARTAWIQSTIGALTTQGTYHAIDPVRIVDTRNGTGALASGIVGPRSTINPQVSGVAGVPVTVVGLPNTGAFAAVVNVTATAPSKKGWLTVFPTGTPIPNASNLNFNAGQTVANLVTVQLGQGGKISINNTGQSSAAGSVHVIVDLVGWYSNDETGALFHPLAPLRVLDTRTGTTTNPGVGAVNGGASITPTVCDGATGADPTATAVVVNVTALAGPTSGFLTLWPNGAAPNVSNLNFTAGANIANLATVKVGPTCTIKVANSNGAPGFHAPVNVVIDLVGWYGIENTPDGGAHFHAMTPNRIVDTRNGTGGVGGLVGAGATVAPVATVSPVPSTAVAVVMNLTATTPSKRGWLTAYPIGPIPIASNLNFLAGQTVPNLAIVKVHTDHMIRVTNTGDPGGPVANAGSVQIIIDEMGWFE